MGTEAKVRQRYRNYTCLGTIVRGAEGTRTPDFCLAKAALYQLSYGPRADYSMAV